MSLATMAYNFTVGRSGSLVSLVRYNDVMAIRKDNVINCPAVVTAMRRSGLLVPEVYEYTDTSMIMEYIPGITMYQYLLESTKDDLDFMVSELSLYIDRCLEQSTMMDFSSVIARKSEQLGVDVTISNSIYPKSIVHGDLTMDNMLIHDGKLYYIDLANHDFKSVYFDINKLRQDLDGCWFLRNKTNSGDVKIQVRYIRNKLFEKYPMMFDDQIYKLMLSRIIPYVTGSDKQFLENIIKTI